jgi:hypothetical protein
VVVVVVCVWGRDSDVSMAWQMGMSDKYIAVL